MGDSSLQHPLSSAQRVLGGSDQLLQNLSVMAKNYFFGGGAKLSVT